MLRVIILIVIMLSVIDRLIVLVTYISQGQEGLLGTNGLAYFVGQQTYSDDLIKVSSSVNVWCDALFREQKSRHSSTLLKPPKIYLYSI